MSDKEQQATLRADSLSFWLLCAASALAIIFADEAGKAKIIIAAYLF